jgi:hypothetical protein
VRPHGVDELRHPDADVYIVGMKSYGRAPTFLLPTGYEQVRSVVAAIAGDWEAARRVELVLPETGVCITGFAEEDAAAPATACCAPAPVPATSAACCGGPPKTKVDACCVKDEEAKAAGASGCGCNAPAATVALAAPATSACCG